METTDRHFRNYVAVSDNNKWMGFGKNVDEESFKLAINRLQEDAKREGVGVFIYETTGEEIALPGNSDTVNRLEIVKNHRVSETEYDYIIINREDNTAFHKQMTPAHAQRFVDKLDAVPISPLAMHSSEFTIVSADDFNFPLPF